MAYNTVKELFVAICDSIRAKKGTTEPIAHQDIPSEIDSACDKCYEQGRTDGEESGYQTGYDVGYKKGHDLGYNNGYTIGYDKGIEEVKDLEAILASI